MRRIKTIAPICSPPENRPGQHGCTLPSTEVQSESTGVHGSPFVVPLARPQDSVLHLVVGGRVPNIVYVRRAVAGSRAVVIAALRTMGDERF